MAWPWCLTLLSCSVACAALPEQLANSASCSAAAEAGTLSDCNAHRDSALSEQQALLQIGGARLAKVAKHISDEATSVTKDLRRPELLIDTDKEAMKARRSDGSPIIVLCKTTKGSLHISVKLEEYPIGAWHFLEMVVDGFFTDLGIFRVVPEMFAQFGISGSPSLNDRWKGPIADDKQHAGTQFPKGTISFAGNGINSRTSQLFIALADGVVGGTNPWETPVGHIMGNLTVLDEFYSGYGDGPPSGQGPDQALIHDEGNAYLQHNFSKLDYFKSCHVVNYVPGSDE